VTGPLETFANAGGVHVARAILAEFAENAPKVRFAQDSPLEGAVTSEPVSEVQNLDVDSGRVMDGFRDRKTLFRA
jgi:hypothetical protein